MFEKKVTGPSEPLERATVLRATAVFPDQVLVAVPTLNEAGHIEACLKSLIDGDPFMAGVRVSWRTA